MSQTRATLIGSLAVLLWSMLALLTSLSGTVPPFQLSALTFSIGAGVGLFYCVLKPARFKAFIQPLPVWLLGVSGLFGYHFFYFTALRNAPPSQAGLIAYLWPLMIILFSAFLPGEKLRFHHVAGGVLGLIGAGMLVTNGTSFAFDSQYLFGYAMAFVCAFIWSAYSVASRLFANVPSQLVAGFCAATALLSVVAHLTFEQTVWPTQASQWLAIIALGLGPVGLAFYLWDFGVKRGNIQTLGAASYAAPLLHTLILIIAGLAVPSKLLLIACLLITGGAVVAAKDIIAPKTKQRDQSG